MKNRLDSDSRTAQLTLESAGVSCDKKIIDAFDLMEQELIDAIEIHVEELPRNLQANHHKLCVKKFTGVKSV